MKQCTKCKETKTLENYSKDRQKKTGYSSQCKSCKASYEKQYLASNKDKVYARNKEYNSNHKAEKQSYDANRRATMRETINAKKRDRYHNGGKEVEAIWRAKNADKVTMYARNSRYKRRLLEQSFDLTNTELLEWSKQQLKICAYCGNKCEDTFHIDHIEPLSKNGEHSVNNLTIACPSCNQSKSNKTLLYWLAFRQQN